MITVKRIIVSCNKQFEKASDVDEFRKKIKELLHLDTMGEVFFRYKNNDEDETDQF